MTKKVKILVVEDDKFLLKVYNHKLTKEGFDVVLATTGEEGVTKAMSEIPDLILLDIILPRKNGFDVLSDLKLNSNTKNIPVIILSNLGQEEDVKTGMELGAIDYLVKTDVGIHKLVNIVKKHLVKSSKKDNL